MTAWTEDLKQLFPQLSERYEVRPREDGVIIFCTSCGNRVSDTTLVTLRDMVKEAEEHEKLNHLRRTQ